MLTLTMLPVASPFAAQARLSTKLQRLASLAGLTPEQFSQGRLGRGSDLLRQPPTGRQLAAAYDVATRLEETLPDHAGTALRTRAALCLGLLDPAGADKLAQVLNYARMVLGIEA